jgi:AcrR family transcriptional regulator
MPPKVQFTKQQLIDAAYEVARSEGIDNITIRKVADRMGSSIAPIYVNFKDVGDLKRAVFRKLVDVSQQMLITQDSGNPFQDIGTASIRFAMQEPVLFRDLVMKHNEYMKDYDQDMGPVLIDQMKADADLQGFTDEELAFILLKMRIFQIGLSVMAANGLLPEAITEENMVAILNSTAADVIAAARFRKSGTLED